MTRAREIVAQWIMPIHRINNGFRKVEKMRVAIGLLLRETAKRKMTLVVAVPRVNLRVYSCEV